MTDFVHPTECACYECAGAEREWVDGRVRTVNDVKHHTFGEPCDDCGKPKSEYRDLGRKGYYVCWWCTRRVAGSPD